MYMNKSSPDTFLYYICKSIYKLVLFNTYVNIFSILLYLKL